MKPLTIKEQEQLKFYMMCLKIRAIGERDAKGWPEYKGDKKEDKK